MSLEWVRPAAASGPLLTFATLPIREPTTSLPSSARHGRGSGGAFAAQKPLLADRTVERQRQDEVNISRILRALERPPQHQQLNEFGRRPSHATAPPQEEYFNHLLYPDSEEPPPPPQPPNPLVPQTHDSSRPTHDYLPQPTDYHRPNYQLGRPNKNLKPIHVSISQQTVNGLLSLLLLSVISIYGCMGTIFIMSALTVVESLQTRGNCYLVSLAMAHLLVTLLVIPSSALQIMAGDTLNGQRVCHYQWLTLEFSLIVSQLSFMLIAADNYLGYNCSEKVVTQVASFVQGQQQQQQQQAATNCGRHQLATTAAAVAVEHTPPEPPDPGSGVSPPTTVAATKGAHNYQYQTTAQSMQADFMAQSAQVAARLEKSREQQRQHASKLAEARKQSTLIRRLLSNLPGRLTRPTTTATTKTSASTSKTQVHTQAQAQPPPPPNANCPIRRESWHLKSSLADNASSGFGGGHSAPGARFNEWPAGGEANQPGGKSRRLAHQFASETGSRLERPGGCVNYRNCCGRVKVLFWIACIWASALVYVLYQHELSFGARFCSTSGSNSYQWASNSASSNSNGASQQQQQQQQQRLKLQSLAGAKISAFPPLSPVAVPLTLQATEAVPMQLASGRVPAGPSRGAPSPFAATAAAASDERPAGRREQRTAGFNQLAALADGRRQQRASQETLFGTVNAGASLSSATIESSSAAAAASLADNQSALTRSSESLAKVVVPQSSNPLEWTAPKVSDAKVASALDRAEVARGGHSSEVAARHASNRYEQNHHPKNWHVRSGDGEPAAVDHPRGELLLRNKNDGRPVILDDDDVDHAAGRTRQVQVSRLRRARDPDSDRALDLDSGGRRAAATKQGEEGTGRANFIIHPRSMESRNHFGVVAAAASTWRGKDDELPSVAVRHFDSRGSGRGTSNSSGSDKSERAILQTRVPLNAHILRAHFTRSVSAQQPGRRASDERLDTKPARATAATVHLDDDDDEERRYDDDDDRHDGRDDKTQASNREATHTSQARQQQHQQRPEPIDGSQRRTSASDDDHDDYDAPLAPRWRVESRQRVSELNVIVANSTGDQLLLWLPVSNGPRLESRRQLAQKHEQPQTNNNNADHERARVFSGFPLHNDDELSSSSMSRIGPKEFGGGEQNKREQRMTVATDGARLDEGAAPRAAAQIIMHASGASNERRARVSPAKLIAAVSAVQALLPRRDGPRDNKHELAVRMTTTTTTLNDKPEFGAASENNEIEGEKSRWRRSSVGNHPSPCDSCHRNTQQLEEMAGERVGSSWQANSGKQIASARLGQTRDRDKFSDGSTNNSADKVGSRSQRACDNLNACDKQTIDRDKQTSSASPLSASGGRERPHAPARGPEERNERLRTLMNNNNNKKLERHSTGELGPRLEWTNALAGGERRMQISDAPQPKLAAGGANLRRARQVQVATEGGGGGGGSSEGQLNLNPIDYGARPPPVDEAAPRFPPPPEQRQTSAASGGGSATNQRERRRDYFWHMLLCAVLAPSLLAALLFARAYIQMKEFKMRPYKPMPAAALNSTPPALLTPRSPIPLIAQRQVYAFDLPAGVVVVGESSGPKLTGGPADMSLPSNVACVGSPSGFARAPHEAEDSRSCVSLVQTDAADTEDEEEDAGECLARAAQETVRRVSEITNEGSSFKRRPLARHAHTATSEACQPSAAVVRPPAPPPRLSQPTTTTNVAGGGDGGGGKRLVNQVMSAPPPLTCLAGVDNRYTFTQQQQYPRPLFNGPQAQVNYQVQHPSGSVPAQWQRPSFNHCAPGTAASYSAPPSAGFQQLVNYGAGFPPEFQQQQQQVAEPSEQFSHSSRYRRQRHSSPVAYAARTLNADVSPIMESPHGFIVGQEPAYYQQQNPLNRNQGHAQSFHYGTAAHHYQSYAARQAAAQQQQQQQRDYRTAQQRASLQARGARNRLPLIESSRSSGEAADSTTTPANEHQASAQRDQQAEAVMSQALANVIRSVHDQGAPTGSYDKQRQLSPAAEPSAGSAASSLKRRLAPKPLELPPAVPQSKISSNQIKGNNQDTASNTKVILCTYSYMTDDQLLKSNMIVFLVHSACWVPFVALCISAQYRDSFTGELRDLVWWLAVLNCCSCSYLYALTNKDFREAFHKLFFYCFCQSHVTLQRKTPIFRRQLDVDRKGNLRVHIIPGLNVYSSKLFAASGGLRDGLGNDLSAFAASASTQHAASGRPPPPTQQPPAPGPGLTPNGLAPPQPPPVSIAPGH